MALYRGTAPLKAYLGDGRPLNVYLGDKKLAGWAVQAYSGPALDITGTYEDAADVTVTGNTVVHNGALSSVEGKTLTCRTADSSRSSSVSIPTLRKVGTVADTYVPATGAYVKAISDVVTLDGSRNWSFTTSNSGYKRVEAKAACPGNVDYGGATLKYDGTQLLEQSGLSGGDRSAAYNGQEVITAFNSDTGWNDTLAPTSDEVKAYFYGWRMCNADGSSPYYRSEIPYTPSTWAEWGIPANSGGSISNDSLTVTNPSTAFGCGMATKIKTTTNYGFLVHIQSNTRTRPFFMSAANKPNPDRAFPTDFTIFGGVTGNVKTVMMSASTIKFNIVRVWADVDAGSITIDSYRIFELPPGSQIESDFANLTADQLAAKYTFNGLCPKNWQHVTDGQGQTATLPTASYAGYTPYKMLYQLATPTTTTQAVQQMPTYRDETVIETDADTWCLPTISATAKVMS